MRGIARTPYGVRAPPLPVCTAMSTLAAEKTGEATLVQEYARLREHNDACVSRCARSVRTVAAPNEAVRRRRPRPRAAHAAGT